MTSCLRSSDSKMVENKDAAGFEGESTCMLKSPVIINSEGDVTKLSRIEEKSEIKFNMEEDGGR